MAAATRTLTFSVASSTGASDPAWSNPSNILASDDARAIANYDVSADDVSDILHASGLQRTIPPEAELKGIQLRYEMRRTIEADIHATTIRLEENEALAQGSDNKGGALNLNTSEVTTNFPTATDDLWNGPFHVFCDLAARGFGAGLQCTAISPPANSEARVDQVTARIHYTVPGRYRSRGLRRWQNGFR